MTLKLKDFPEFFAEINDGQSPFAWQKRLMRFLVDNGRWPEQISAPTGAGKTNVVDCHIFANALAACGSGPRVPRRLATVVGRRALVDSHHEKALTILEVLSNSPAPIAARVREALASLVDDEPAWLSVVQIRGGISPDWARTGRDWIDDPRVCSVIAATPDMWGSRLLMRGYGTSRAARPREAGLLSHDAVMVLDEAHLNRQLLYTARRVSDLVEASASRIGVPPLNVVETTATPGSPLAGTVGVEANDLELEAQLQRRLTRPKPLTLLESPSWTGSDRVVSDAHVKVLTKAVSAQQRLPGAGPTGCLVNRVDTAARVSAELRKAGLRVVTWVGRQRPMDLNVLLERHGGFFHGETTADFDVLVATQTVEVGVDMDLRALVTELAPGSAIAQRAGRVNRRGLREEGPVTVIRPRLASLKKDFAPYKAGELRDSLAWLESIANTSQGLSPWALCESPPPSGALPRRFLKRVEVYDTHRWARTSSIQFCDEDLTLWLHDDLEKADVPGGLVMRQPLPEDDTEALTLLSATPPVDDEVFPVTLGVLRKTVAGVLSGDRGNDSRVWLFRDGGVVALESAQTLRPGDTVIVNGSTNCTLSGVVVEDVPPEPERPETAWGAAGQVIVRDHASDEALYCFAGMSAEDATKEWQSEHSSNEQLILPPSPLDEAVPLSWLVVTSPATVQSREDDRQVWSSRPVPLTTHAAAVQQRARADATAVGVTERLREILAVAGLHHDDGKAHRGFQILLGAASGSELAKSGTRSSQVVGRMRRESGLPRGWRHEHRSAAMSSVALSTHSDHDLIVRLVGTSHGHGRGVPLDTGRTLADDNDPQCLVHALGSLFTEGGWDALIDSTDREWGVWGCCYLEALLRSADCRVSKEGS